MPDPHIDFSQYGSAAPPPPSIDFSKYGQAAPEQKSLGQRVTDKLQHMGQGLWNAAEQTASAPAVAYEMYKKSQGEPNQLSEMPGRAALTFAGAEEPVRELELPTASTVMPAATKEAATGIAGKIMRRVPYLGKVIQLSDLAGDIADAIGGKGEAPAAAKPPVAPLPHELAGKGVYGTPLSEWGKTVSQTAAPTAASEVSDVASALKNTFGKAISQEDATSRATAAVAKHPGDFDNAFREAVSGETPAVKQPAPIAKPIAAPQIDFSKYGKPAPETFERTLATANQREVLGAPDLGPTSIQLPKGPAPEVGTPQDIAETRNIQDAIRNQAEREAMLEDVGASRRFREGNAVEQGKWANVATARTGSDVSARVPYPRFTEGLEDINLHPFTGAAAQVPPEDLVPILEKSLKQAKLAAKAKNRLAIPQ